MNNSLEKLRTVIIALNSVQTHGQQNLLNLGGAIGILEDVTQNLMQLQQQKDEGE